MGVHTADALVLLHDGTGRGLYVELGIALACPHTQIVVIGAPRDSGACVFYFLKRVHHVADAAEAVRTLGLLSAARMAIP
jgi:hypothetical protein